MTTQEINRYITVASDWERKYSYARETMYRLELQLIIQDTAIQRIGLENIKLKNHRRYLACALIGFFIGQVIIGII